MVTTVLTPQHLITLEGSPLPVIPYSVPSLQLLATTLDLVSASTGLPFIDIPYKGSHAVCGLFFPYVFKVHPCCGTYLCLLLCVARTHLVHPFINAECLYDLLKGSVSFRWVLLTAFSPWIWAMIFVGFFFFFFACVKTFCWKLDALNKIIWKLRNSAFPLPLPQVCYYLFV
jgi:hypothetical protein